MEEGTELRVHREVWIRLTQWVESEHTQVLVILGEKGSGKSELLAKFAAFIGNNSPVVHFDGLTLKAFGVFSSRYGVQIDNVLGSAVKLSVKGTATVDWLTTRRIGKHPIRLFT